MVARIPLGLKAAATARQDPLLIDPVKLASSHHALRPSQADCHARLKFSVSVLKDRPSGQKVHEGSLQG